MAGAWAGGHWATGYKQASEHRAPRLGTHLQKGAHAAGAGAQGQQGQPGSSRAPLLLPASRCSQGLQGARQAQAGRQAGRRAGTGMGINCTRREFSRSTCVGAVSAAELQGLPGKRASGTGIFAASRLCGVRI